MAISELNPVFRNLKGNLGNIIFYDNNGRLCARTRVIPRNPKTPAQQHNRCTFAEAVKRWQELPAEDKAMYRKRAKKRSRRAYNLFISEYMKGRTVPVVSCGHISGGLTGASRHDTPLQLRSCSVAVPLQVARCPGDAINTGTSCT